MATPGERRALMFFATLVVLGAGMRAAQALNGGAPASDASRAALEAQLSAVDSVRKHGKPRGRGKGRRAKKPQVVVPAIIDMDVATAEQIETLRGIGPALARRIVADRDSLGPFGSLEELQRVKGIGPKLAAKLDSSVTFSLLPHPSTTAITRSSQPRERRRKPRRGDTDS